MGFCKDQTFYPLGGNVYCYVKTKKDKVRVLIKHFTANKATGRVKATSRGVCLDDLSFKRLLREKKLIKKEINNQKKILKLRQKKLKQFHRREAMTSADPTQPHLNSPNTTVPVSTQPVSKKTELKIAGSDTVHTPQSDPYITPNDGGQETSLGWAVKQELSRDLTCIIPPPHPWEGTLSLADPVSEGQAINSGACDPETTSSFKPYVWNFSRPDMGRLCPDFLNIVI